MNDSKLKLGAHVTCFQELVSIFLFIQPTLLQIKNVTTVGFEEKFWATKANFLFNPGIHIKASFPDDFPTSA